MTDETKTCEAFVLGGADEVKAILRRTNIDLVRLAAGVAHINEIKDVAEDTIISIRDAIEWLTQAQSLAGKGLQKGDGHDDK